MSVAAPGRPTSMHACMHASYTGRKICEQHQRAGSKSMPVCNVKHMLHTCALSNTTEARTHDTTHCIQVQRSQTSEGACDTHGNPHNTQDALISAQNITLGTCKKCMQQLPAKCHITPNLATLASTLRGDELMTPFISNSPRYRYSCCSIISGSMHSIDTTRQACFALLFTI